MARNIYHAIHARELATDAFSPYDALDELYSIMDKIFPCSANHMVTELTHVLPKTLGPGGINHLVTVLTALMYHVKYDKETHSLQINW